MDPHNTSIIFPAFVPELTGREKHALQGYEDLFTMKLEGASTQLGIDLSAFDFGTNNFSDNEEISQYISYVYSCSVSDILALKGVRPSYTCGYSMGLYAALYYSRSMEFNDGLRLLRRAWELFGEVIKDDPYCMGMIVGLDRQDIQMMASEVKEVTICNQNNPHTFFISGRKEGVVKILELAREEGAIRYNPLPVSMPYHTDLLKRATRGFDALLEEVAINDPVYPYMSSLHGRIIESREELKQELSRNLYHRMDWYAAMKQLIALGTERFYECGLGDGLTRNFRFIDRSVNALPVDRIDELG